MTMRAMRTLGLAAALLIAASCSSDSGPADEAVWSEARGKDGAGALDGRRFEVQVTEVGKSASEKETLEFHGGRFHSVECDEHAFASGAYAATKNGDVMTFRSTTESATEGRIDWRGMVRGDSIEGAFTWTKKDQKPTDYSFRGTRVY